MASLALESKRRKRIQRVGTTIRRANGDKTDNDKSMDQTRHCIISKDGQSSKIIYTNKISTS